MARWVMIIDLRKCIGCGTCRHVCAEMHPSSLGNFYRRVVEKDPVSDNPRFFFPLNCMHCGAPSCLSVCPTGATCQRDSGIVEINHDFCLGCGYCSVACPYDARTITSGDKITTDNETKDSIKRDSDRIGVCVKCDFCLQLLKEGLRKGLIPGTDAEATPLCVNFCLAKSIHFGDLDDPQSEVSKLIRGNTTIRLQEETASDPAVYYIVDQENEICCWK